MKKSDFTALEAQLAELPYDQKSALIQSLTRLIESHVESVIDTASRHGCCRHCGGASIKKWGKANGLQRYKCNEKLCGKTFNVLTATPLARLRLKGKWLDYLLCMVDSLPLRKAATRLDIDLTTAFRWRHRFLRLAAKTQAKQVAGIVEADEAFFAQSYKGSRTIPGRKARKRGGEGARNKKDNKTPVLIVRDRGGHVCDFVLDDLSQENIHDSLTPIVDRDSILCTDGAIWYKNFAEQEKLSHHRLVRLSNQRVIGKEFHIQNVNAYISRLKTWMSRFNGVGTKYLQNYLGWRRLFETTNASQVEWLSLMLKQ